MKPWIISSSTAMALLFATGAVRADVTPEQVWSSWKDMAKSYGEVLTAGSEDRQGDTLVVKGIALSMDQAGTKVSGTLGEMRFRDQGDGTVAITASDSYKMTVDTPAADSQPAAKMSVDVAMPGMKTVASGTPEAMKFAVDAPEMDMHVAGGPGDPAKGSLKLDVAMKGTSGTYSVAQADSGRSVDYDMAAKSADIASHIVDPTQKTDVSMKLTLTNLAANSAGVYVGADQMADLTAALNAGFKVNSKVSYGAGNYVVTALQEGMPTRISGDVGSGEFGVAMDKSHFQMVSGSKQVTMAVDSKAMPIPGLGGSFGEFAFNLLVPLEKSDSPSPFSMVVKLVDLKLSDTIWGMFDPGGQLPHDPATVVLDTKGTATLTADLTDKGAQEAMGGTPPGLLNSFDINQLQVKLAGAELTGAGGLTFNNDDMTSFNGIPAPTGKVALKATGLMGLIDKLVSMGLVPQDQAMQGKMMLGMFAKPGDGEDTLVSNIEFDGKSMSINGMEMPTH